MSPVIKRRRVAPAGFDPTRAYRMMTRMRLVDEALTQAWADGLVPGEYHSGIGEEGINAGVILHLDDRDAMALDHRNTAGFIARGADPQALMLEVLGTDQGMNAGMAGHMHLLDPDLRTAADGIVGASGPLAVGNAIASTMLAPGSVAVAMHGEAAMNQGMLMEAYNLAVAWKLPVLFVCKDNKWSITTYTPEVTGGTPVERARAFGLAVETVRGNRVEDVHAAAGVLLQRAREGKGPGFLHATCHRPGGHFEGDGLVRLLKTPGTMAAAWGPGLVGGVTADEGGSAGNRAAGMAEISKRGAQAARDWTLGARLDPLRAARPLLDAGVVDQIEAEERPVIEAAIAHARAAVAGRGTFGTRKAAK
ncbi:MAG TPA: thiamine pyrophosphate-dependent dehydrogenase E1 component subunit alpha [Actinomycetota bacterium]|nr:thiamine pyrophosphate-dependent dehydrogenase E1 component subunit alpha [Actinomycetota bacterium]